MAATTVSGNALESGDSGGGESTTGEVEISVGQVPEDRRIIRTANVLTEVGDVAEAAATVRAAALATDGYLFSQELAEEYGTVVVKMPADRFEDALESMVGIGDVRRQSTNAEELALPDNLPADPDDDRDGFLGGLDDGLDVLGAIGSGIATAAGFLLPFLPAIAILGGAVWWLWRRRGGNRSATDPTRPPPPTEGTTPAD